jgi:cytochrome c
MKKRWVVGGLLVGSLLLARVHPFGDAGLYAGKSTALEHMTAPPEVKAVLEAKCADCHSSGTRAPLYGRFAPVSWLMERDIVEARKEMDLSQWDTYPAAKREVLAAKIAAKSKSGEMPLIQYRLIHWGSEVNASEARALADWARGSTGGEIASAGGGEGDAERGKAVFENRCTGCHSLTQAREGPPLRGLFGRKAGTVPGFPYSTVLKASGIIWDGAELERWLTDPDAMVHGTDMEFRVARPQERKDLVKFFSGNP